ncbi:tyrosine-type recombinase/integrase [Demequina sp. B12]|uniref:tyrosine-type recombinase/integrase n=1 Tax=Demequina sp. B12 TaxID=2992757 RepID=UPI00237AC6E4|nr:tyrosine-type recombinase/integrase [Demequina sp. B12]MDE0571803.1 tyrosine-type recombinase/integrase [Demequina sp. B12]
MAIESTRDGRYRAKPYYRSVALPTKICVTRTEAEAWCATQIALVKSGVETAAGRRPLREYIAPWLTHVRASKSLSTVQTCESHAKRFPQWLLALHADEITPAHLQRVLNEWTRTDGTPSTRSTLTRLRADLSSLFTYIVSTRAISASPAKGLRVPEARGPRVGNPLTPEDVSDLYAQWHTRNPQAANAALLLILTGLRWSELRALRAKSIRTSPDITWLHITHSHQECKGERETKNSKPRTVPLTAQALEIVQEAAADKQPEDLLFPRLWASAFKRKLAWEDNAAGHTLHDLRHTAISTWLARGIDPVTVRDWAGHSSIDVTNRYAHHLGVNRDIAALAVLNSAGTPQAPTPDRSTP